MESIEKYGVINDSVITRSFMGTMWQKSAENLGLDWDLLFTDSDSGARERSKMDLIFEGAGFVGFSAFCISADGNKHIHFAIVSNDGKTKHIKSTSKKLGNSHLDEIYGTKEQCRDYVLKNPPYDEKGEIVPFTFGDLSVFENIQGSRRDLDNLYSEFDKAVSEGTLRGRLALDSFLTQFSSDVRCRTFENRYFRLLNLNQDNFRKVRVIYVEGVSGSGKTYGSYKHYPDLFHVTADKRTSFPFDGYAGEKVILFNELRPGAFSPAELFDYIDGYRMNVNIKGGRCPALWDTIIIASAMPLNDWFIAKDDSTGQDNNRTQFLRRITDHLIASGGEWYQYNDYLLGKLTPFDSPDYVPCSGLDLEPEIAAFM